LALTFYFKKYFSWFFFGLRLLITKHFRVNESTQDLTKSGLKATATETTIKRQKSK
jgi:hypothetical protein